LALQGVGEVGDGVLGALAVQQDLGEVEARLGVVGAGVDGVLEMGEGALRLAEAEVRAAGAPMGGAIPGIVFQALFEVPRGAGVVALLVQADARAGRRSGGGRETGGARTV
jgi:hypothetical protein